MQAKHILFQLAKHVEPLMRHHNLIVPVLREMEPEAPTFEVSRLGKCRKILLG